jgi:plastocyanin
MFSRIVPAMLIAFTAVAVMAGADIEGQIIIKRKLSKRHVTAASGTYHRGTAVELRTDTAEDPLAFERTHVVVYLEGSLPSEPVNAAIEQKNRRFLPDLLVIPAGSTVSFPNRDLIFHNVFSLSKPKVFDLGNYRKDETRNVVFAKPGIVHLNCHLHPNMGAVIFVTPNAWSTRPDPAGRFILPNVPPGDYKIIAWHKAAGFFRQHVRVAENHAPSVEFLIPFTEAEPRKMAVLD